MLLALRLLLDDGDVHDSRFRHRDAHRDGPGGHTNPGLSREDEGSAPWLFGCLEVSCWTFCTTIVSSEGQRVPNNLLV